MKKLFLLLFLIPLLSFAQRQAEIYKPVICFDVAIVFELFKDRGMLPIFAGKSESSNIVIFVDVDTKEWVALEHNENVGCLLGTGTGYIKIPQPNKQPTTYN